MSYTKECSNCDGTGIICPECNQGRVICSRCNGTGIVSMSSDEIYQAHKEQLNPYESELKGKALAKFERRERQAEQGWRKGWHR